MRWWLDRTTQSSRKTARREEQLAEASRAAERQHDANRVAQTAKNGGHRQAAVGDGPGNSDTDYQISLAKQQIAVDDQLATKGLVTKQTVVNDQLKVGSLQGNIAKLQGQISQLQADGGHRNQVNQSSVENHNKLSELSRTVRQLESDLELSSHVVSTNAGRVVEVKIYPGAIVNAGEAIISIESGVATLEAVAYVPSAKAKEINPACR